MGTKYRHVKCPRCKKIGVLRPKDKRLNKLYVLHYDPEKYKKTGNGKRWHYLGDLNKQNQKWLEALIEDNLDHKLWHKYFVFSSIKELLPVDEEEKTEFWDTVMNLRKKSKGLQSKDTSYDLTLFAELINELRKIRKAMEVESKIIDKEVTWNDGINCPNCKIELLGFKATFRGVQTYQKIRLHYPGGLRLIET